MDIAKRNAEIIGRRVAGEYPTEIAAAMGLTRNAVIGACYRAGLSNPSVDRSLIMKRFGRAPKGEAVGSAKLTEADVRAIRAAYAYGVRGCGVPAIARQFGVAAKTVWLIVIGRTWRHVA